MAGAICKSRASDENLFEAEGAAECGAIKLSTNLHYGGGGIPAPDRHKIIFFLCVRHRNEIEPIPAKISQISDSGICGSQASA